MRQRKVNEHPLTKSKHATNLTGMASPIDQYATKFHLDLLFFNDLSCPMVIASWSEAKIAGLGYYSGGGKKARKAYALEKYRLTLVAVQLTSGFFFKAVRYVHGGPENRIPKSYFKAKPKSTALSIWSVSSYY